jgi:hypothetical protein
VPQSLPSHPVRPPLLHQLRRVGFPQSEVVGNRLWHTLPEPVQHAGGSGEEPTEIGVIDDIVPRCKVSHISPANECRAPPD